MTLRLTFRAREGLWWAQIASVTQIASGRDGGGQWWWARIPSVTRIASGRVVVGTEGLLVFQVREVVVVGRESPPSLELRAGGWWLAGKAPVAF